MTPDLPNRVPRRERRQLARAELWMQLAMSADRWAHELTETDGGRPVSEWPADDALATLLRTYQLSPADLARECQRLGELLEARAIRSGYGGRWDE